MNAYRKERDSLGEKLVPDKVYYGIQTVRALENFPVSGIRANSEFIWATAVIKKAAALANMEEGVLENELGEAIVTACNEIISGGLIGEFVVDVFQAGAGTSHHMNANEVIANRANELLGLEKGRYERIRPNDHVNIGQSTNDVFPTAMRLAILKCIDKLIDSLKTLYKAFSAKSLEFKDIIKSASTHLQDAVPTTLGNEFSGYSYIISEEIKKIDNCLSSIAVLGIGGTAAGTGVNSAKGYRDAVIGHLNKITGFTLYGSDNLFGSMQSMSDFTAISGALKNLSLELIKIANDIRLLGSGPTTGFGELILPPLQPGSSIMPGKVNPVMAEMLNMVCFQVAGNDLAVSMAAQAGQIDLNVMMPVIAYNILTSIEILGNAVALFSDKCISGLSADIETCRKHFEKSLGIATILNPYIGYLKAAEIAKEASQKKESVIDIIIENGLLTKEQIEEIINNNLNL